MRLQEIKLTMYVNADFSLPMAYWMPVINFRKCYCHSYSCDVVCYPLLYQLRKESCVYNGKTEFVNQMSRAMFSVLKRRELLNHNGCDSNLSVKF